MCKTVFEFAWRVTQQLVVYEHDESDLSKIKGWGSGFFLEYRKILFLVTADHCIHYDDYKEGRLGTDDRVFVANNIVDRKAFGSMLTPFGSFFFFEKMDPAYPTIPDLQDFAFSMRENSFQAPFLTVELVGVDGVICEAGKEKFIMKEDSVVDFNSEKYYVSVGTCLNRIKNGMINERNGAIHCDLRFREYDRDGNAVLEYPYGVKEDHWTGLSGGPIIDNECHLAGVLIRVSEVANTIIAVPIKKVIRFMDFAIRYEADPKEGS